MKGMPRIPLVLVNLSRAWLPQKPTRCQVKGRRAQTLQQNAFILTSIGNVAEALLEEKATFTRRILV